MKEIKDFKNIHKGEDIYIICSGRSLDYMSMDFFENKIKVGINQAYKKVSCDYYVRKEAALLEKIFSQDYEKIKDSYFFVSRHDGGFAAGERTNKNLKIVKNNLSEYKNILIYETNQNISRSKINPDFVQLSGDFFLATDSTITTGINIAAFMGAKNIILCGHDCVSINGEPNFLGYHSDESYKIKHAQGKLQYSRWLSGLEKQTREMKYILKKKYNINLLSINPFVSMKMGGNALS
jgi:hypothetical protein